MAVPASIRVTFDLPAVLSSRQSLRTYGPGVPGVSL